MVWYVWLYKPWPFIILCPVEFTTVNYNSTNCCSVSTDELCCWVNHDISTVLNRTDKIWCSKGIIYDKRDSCLMSDICNFFDIYYLWVWISECLDFNSFCILFDGSLDSIIIEWIYECSLNSVIRKCVCQEIVCTAVDILCCNDMVTCVCYCLESICECRCSGTNSKCCHATLECCNSSLKYILCRVCQSAVDISCISESESVCRMLTVMEHIWWSKVDWNCSRICNRIRCFLSYM